MEIAVMSDIHGNYVALRKCIDYCIAHKINTFIFLGDYTGELAYPEKTMQMLFDMKKNYNCYFIRGNKEDYWHNYRVGGEQGWKKYDSTTGSLYYTYHHLSPQSMEFYETLPIVQELSIEGFPLMTVCHGSPDYSNEKLMPNQQRTFEIMEKSKTDIILCGHTHRQRTITHTSKYVLNPGAVGVSLGADGKSQFMILSNNQENDNLIMDCTSQEENDISIKIENCNGLKVYYLSMLYDVEKVIADLQEAGLDQYAPSWCKITQYLLRKGDISHGAVLARAMELCKEAQGECIWPNVPELYWQQATCDMLNN